MLARWAELAGRPVTRPAGGFLSALAAAVLIAAFATGASPALAADESQAPMTAVAEGPGSSATPTDEGATSDAGADVGPELGNVAVSEASNDAQVAQTVEQGQQTEGSSGAGTAQSQQLEQNAQVDQEADSEATAEHEAANAGQLDSREEGLSNSARSEASNEAEVRQESKQEQGGGAEGADSSQIQRAEQNAEVNQRATSEAIGGQAATSMPATSGATPESDWSAILTQLPLPSGSEAIVTMAQNGSLIFQAIWQVQHGCSNHCTATSQSQSATQNAGTTQDATALAGGESAAGTGAAGGASPGTAESRNRSVTVQFIWQTQIGCVAFCYETTQTQIATQWAQTTQSASAEGAASALAENLSRTIQLVWQLQEGCRYECHGTSQLQVTGQAQDTTQSATARGDIPVLGFDGTVLLPGWLVALAENLGVTIQTIYQLQEAVCAEYCDGGSQVQDAVQLADVDQGAAARAAQAPAAEPPEQPSTTTEPPAAKLGATADPAPATAAALAAIRDPSSPASRRLRSQLIEVASRGGDSMRHSLVLVLPSGRWMRPSKTPAMSKAPLAATFSAVASHSVPRRPPKSSGAQASNSLASAPFGVTPDRTTAGGSLGWLWIALLVASIALVPPLRRVTG